VSDNDPVTRKLGFQGRIAVENSGEMRTTLSYALRQKPAALVVDLSDVSYMDTSGVATLLEAAGNARKQGTRLILSGLKDQPRFLFETAHLDRLFDTSAPEAST
jgi:anti-sigma B factor antagonist